MGKKNVEMYLSMHLNIYGSDYELHDVQLCYPYGIQNVHSSWRMVLPITVREGSHSLTIFRINYTLTLEPTPVYYEHL